MGVARPRPERKNPPGHRRPAQRRPVEVTGEPLRCRRRAARQAPGRGVGSRSAASRAAGRRSGRTRRRCSASGRPARPGRRFRSGRPARSSEASRRRTSRKSWSSWRTTSGSAPGCDISARTASPLTSKPLRCASCGRWRQWITTISASWAAADEIVRHISARSVAGRFEANSATTIRSKPPTAGPGAGCGPPDRHLGQLRTAARGEPAHRRTCRWRAPRPHVPRARRARPFHSPGPRPTRTPRVSGNRQPSSFALLVKLKATRQGPDHRGRGCRNPGRSPSRAPGFARPSIPEPARYRVYSVEGTSRVQRAGADGYCGAAGRSGRLPWTPSSSPCCGSRCAR